MLFIEDMHMKNFQILFTDVKRFMGNEVNRLFLLIILVNLVMFLCLALEIHNLKKTINLEAEKLNNQIIQVNKKVDFRYFNTTHSLEDIHNLKIDTHNGEIKKKY